MRGIKRPTRNRHTPPAIEHDLDLGDGAGAGAAGIPDTAASTGVEEPSVLDEETWEIFRVRCPDCLQPIALLADEEALPEHAVCDSPWNPFGLSVCAGSGRSVEHAGAADDLAPGEEQDVASLLTLPRGLDWRMQPFSHVGGPGSRPMRPVRP